MVVDSKGNLHDNKGLFARKDGVNLRLAGVTEKKSLPCKINLHFFAEKGLDKQTPRELKKGIRSLQKRIKEHEHKIANPHLYWKEWESFGEGRKQREIFSWEREIRRFELSIKYRKDRLKELKMNEIISECIKKLQSLKSRLEDVKSSDERSNGVNTANSTLKQSIDTRCSLLEEIYGEPDPDAVHTNADYANYCMEFTDDLYEMYKELYQEAGDTPFDRGYKSQLRKFFEMFKPLQAWLEKESLNQVYNS